MVYLKLQKHKQQGVAQRSSAKLSPYYFGPFEVLQWIGNVAYKLRLQPESLVHISCLLPEESLGPTTTVSPPLPPLDPHGAPHVEPEQILQRRMIKSHNQSLIELLVKWSGESEENST